MGELHLEILKNRMTRDYKLNVHVGRPRVSYRETIKKAVKRVEGSCIRQTGGSGLYAKVWIDVEPETQPKGAPVLHFVDQAQRRRHSRLSSCHPSRWGCGRRPSRAAAPAIRWST